MSCQSYAAEDERYPLVDRDCHMLASSAQVIGDDHPQTKIVRDNLASACQEQEWSSYDS
jgi:hypothetical protein